MDVPAVEDHPVRTGGDSVRGGGGDGVRGGGGDGVRGGRGDGVRGGGESPGPPPPVSRRDLVHKTRTLRAQLASLQRNGHCRIDTSRENVFEDSYRQAIY